MHNIKYVEALNEALKEEMKRDKRVILIGEDIGPYGNPFGVTKSIYKEFGPERVIETPISEAGFVGIAIGSANVGLRPVIELMYVDFSLVAMDQIINQTAKLRFMSGFQIKTPMVIRTQGGAGTGDAAQHCQSLEAHFVHTPGLKVVMPSTPADAKGLLKSAIRDDNPVIFIEHPLLYFRKGEVPDEEYTTPLGKAIVRRLGDSITLVSYSYMSLVALGAAEKLAEEGINVEMIDLRSLVPLDIDTVVNSVRKTKKLVIVHQACRRGGVGAEIGMQIIENAFNCLDTPILRIAGLNTPIPYSKLLEICSFPTEDVIINSIKKLFNKS